MAGSTVNLQTGDGWTHLNNLETLQNVQVDGNLTVLGTITGATNSLDTAVVTTITTVGNGTLTAVGIAGGYINRSGPVAAFSDATDSAANIVAQFPGAPIGSTLVFTLKNTTAFMETVTAGAGVTLPATVMNPPFSETAYLITLTNTTVGTEAVTFAHIGSNAIITGPVVSSPASVSITTVGAGVLTAASFVAGIITRGGAQSATAFSDTTDIAANIIAACPNLINKIGTSMLVRVANTTNAPETLTGGTGVTVSGITVIPANSVATYLLTYTATATLTMVGIQLSLGQTTGTFTANGATPVTVANTAVSPASQIMVTLKTVGGTVGTSAPNVRTITPGTGFTIAGIALDTSVYNYTIIG